jgi:hypothetical protein
MRTELTHLQIRVKIARKFAAHEISVASPTRKSCTMGNLGLKVRCAEFLIFLVENSTPSVERMLSRASGKIHLFGAEFWSLICVPKGSTQESDTGICKIVENSNTSVHRSLSARTEELKRSEL